jgi:uncharacterized protein (DUF488 family)
VYSQDALEENRAVGITMAVKIDTPGDGQKATSAPLEAPATHQPSVLTIGHSNGPLEGLIELLLQHHVAVLVDTRSQPYSRHSPHFSRETLQQAVREAGARYLFMGDSLGGRPSARECYDTEGRVSYDKVEERDFYKQGIERLVDGIGRYRVCILCSEEDPIRCHRRLLIGRTLLRRGIEVNHIRGDGTVEMEAAVQARFEREVPEPNQLRLL